MRVDLRREMPRERERPQERDLGREREKPLGRDCGREKEISGERSWKRERSLEREKHVGPLRGYFKFIKPNPGLHAQIFAAPI